MHSSKTCLESRAKLSFLYLLRPDGTEEEEEASLPALAMLSAPNGVSTQIFSSGRVSLL